MAQDATLANAMPPTATTPGDSPVLPAI